MIWGRWKDYIANGNGGNIELKSLDFEYIQKNFRYSILEIYKSTTDDDAILERESWCRLPSKTAICAMFGGQCVT